jgi:hypothetical protein
MQGNERLNRILRRRPHAHFAPGERPHLSRRHFFQLAGTGVACSFLPQRALAQSAPRVETIASVTTKNTARNVVFILLTGAPSHTDTFDYKQSPDTPLDLLKPESRNGVDWPTGLLPKLGDQLCDIAIVRSLRSWALVHNLAQTWAQIGRSPAGALGDIAPNLGSVVALEKAAERKPGQVFPSFLALNSAGGVGEGYFSSAYSPFRLTPAATGLRNTKNPDDATGGGRFAERYALMETMDRPLRQNSPHGLGMEDMDAFYKAARGMMYNPAVNAAFSYSAADSARFGNTNFGNACLVAKQALAANQGTRFIQITLGGWDHHTDIYADANLPAMCRTLDSGVSALLADLKSSGLLNETLVVMCGEFGRTVGRLSADDGRDHFMQQFAMFAGAGVTGGKIIGSTNETGAVVADPGWSRQREVRPEDLEATIYSAMGINWTTVRYDDPFGRGFYYVPNSDEDLYGPIDELWS